MIRPSMVVSACLLALSSSPSMAHSNSAHIEALEKQMDALQQEMKALKAAKYDKTTTEPSVGTASSFGLGSAYDGSDLLINAPNVYKDFSLLKQNQAIEKSVGHPLTQPRVIVSGQIAADLMTHTDPFVGDKSSGVEAGTEIDMSAQLNNWVTGFTSLKAGSVSTTDNANFAMPQAFVSFGNLDCSPFFLTAGKFYIPAGSFSTNMLFLTPTTRSLGRASTPAISGNYTNGGFLSSVFVYNGATKRTGNDRTDGVGGRLNYGGVIDKLHYVVGGSYITNMAYTPTYTVAFAGNNKLQHYVPAAAVNGGLAYGPFSATAEYFAAVRNFSSNDLTYEGHSAQPRAANYEVAYNFDVMGKATSIALGYNRTYEGLALDLPETQYGVTLAVNPVKNTMVSLGWGARKHYSKSTTATRPKGGAGNTTVTGDGALDNAFSVEADLYF
jgi:hypothetical protein